jgi:hypothetical protein
LAARKLEAIQPKAKETTTNRDTLLTVDQHGDPFFGNRLSVQVTPFSNASYETHGTVQEIGEATPVELYPHQNKSLLVVEHPSGQEASPPMKPVLELTVPSPPDSDTKPVLETPPQRNANGFLDVDSPLRNPRAPPQPPAGPPIINVILPTPGPLSPSDENSKQLGYNIEAAVTAHNSLDVDDYDRPLPPQRRPSLLRRALLNRTVSNPHPSGYGTSRGGNILTRALSLKHALPTLSTFTRDIDGELRPVTAPGRSLSLDYPTVDDQPADENRLHPFWRPTRFWDDLEDDDYYYSYDQPQVIITKRSRSDEIRRSMVGGLKKTIGMLPREHHRSVVGRDRISGGREHVSFGTERRTIRRSADGSLKVIKRKHKSSESLREARQKAWEAGRADGGAKAQLARLRLEWQQKGLQFNVPSVQMQWVGLGSLGRKFSERKREKKGGVLKRNISAPTGVRDGVEEVLRGKGYLSREERDALGPARYREADAEGFANAQPAERMRSGSGVDRRDFAAD